MYIPITSERSTLYCEPLMIFTGTHVPCSVVNAEQSLMRTFLTYTCQFFLDLRRIVNPKFSKFNRLESTEKVSVRFNRFLWIRSRVRLPLMFGGKGHRRFNIYCLLEVIVHFMMSLVSPFR